MSKNKRKVMWTESAVCDLESVIEYIAADSPGDARKILKNLRDRATNLETMPMRGRVVPEMARLGLRAWRELIVKPYRIVYRIDKDAVIVMALLDSRRDLEDLLLERLVRP
jgi:toxin ParE1/3/4